LTLNARLVGVDGGTLATWESPASVDANAVAQGLALTHTLEDVGAAFFLDLMLADAEGRVLASNRYAFTRAANLAPLLEVASTTLDIQADGDRQTVTNTGSTTAMFVWLEDARPVGADGFVFFSDNHFCLFPGEARTVGVAWQGVAADARAVSVGAWNTDLSSL
jgi:beta-mannosidase